MSALSGARADFPILEAQSRPEAPFIYLDSAATTLKPTPVIAAIAEYYGDYPANVHRGKHRLSERATDAYESAREDVARFFGGNTEDVVFTRGSTDGLNLVAQGIGLAPEELVLGCVGDHHSTLLPFHARAKMELLPLAAGGGLDLDALSDGLRRERPRAVVLSYASNVTGVVQPMAEVARLCREREVPLVVDGAQAAPHLPIDLHRLDADYFVCSAHKMLGPTGIGMLWLNPERTRSFRPTQLGGQMLNSFAGRRVELKERPYCFEAGTPHVAGAVGFGAAVRYLEALGMENVQAHGRELALALRSALRRVPGVALLEEGEGERIPVVSFTTGPTLHPDVVARVLSERHNVMVRSGRHCADPLFDSLGVASSLRAAAYLYNLEAELERFASSLGELLRA